MISFSKYMQGRLSFCFFLPWVVSAVLLSGCVEPQQTNNLRLCPNIHIHIYYYCNYIQHMLYTNLHSILFLAGIKGIIQEIMQYVQIFSSSFLCSWGCFYSFNIFQLWEAPSFRFAHCIVGCSSSAPSITMFLACILSVLSLNTLTTC